MEGVPALPLVAGGQINPNHQPGPAQPCGADCLGHGLQAGVTVSEMSLVRCESRDQPLSLSLLYPFEKKAFVK